MRRRGRNFEEGTLPIHIANQIIGLRAIEYPRREIRYYLSSLYAMVVVVIILIRRFVDRPVYDSTNFVAWIISGFVNDLEYTIVIGIIVFGHYTSESFHSIRKQAAYVENELQRLGSPINCDRLYKCSLACLIFSTAWATFKCIIYQLYDDPKTFGWRIISTIAGYFVESVGNMVLLDFMTTVMWLRLGFQKINRLLELGLPENDKFRGSNRSKSVDKDLAILNLDSQVFVGDSFTADGISCLAMKPCTIDEKQLYINSVRHVHLNLCTTAKRVYSMFNLPMYLSVGHILLIITVITLYFYVELKYEKDIMMLPLFIIVMFVVDCFVNIVTFGLVCVVCEYTMREINQSAELIYTFGGLEDNIELKDDIHQFKLQMVASRKGLVSSGLTDMGFAFVRKCISWMTTCLVIMVQMGKSDWAHTV